MQKKYEDLTHEEIKHLKDIGVLNGFGGARQSWIVRWIIGRLLNKFSIASAMQHDYGYYIGVTPRLQCDLKFFSAMIEDLGNIYDRDKSRIGLIWNTILCIIAYISIRIFGGKFYCKGEGFSYTENIS